MPLVTKADACKTLGVSLSTVNRHIDRGKLRVQRHRQGNAIRVYVELDDAPTGSGGMSESLIPSPGVSCRDTSGEASLALAEERVRHLEELVSQLTGQLAREQKHTSELVAILRAGHVGESRPERRRWWSFW